MDSLASRAATICSVSPQQRALRVEHFEVRRAARRCSAACDSFERLAAACRARSVCAASASRVDVVGHERIVHFAKRDLHRLPVLDDDLVASRRRRSRRCASIAFRPISGCSRPRPMLQMTAGPVNRFASAPASRAVARPSATATGSSRRAPARSAGSEAASSASARRMSGRRSSTSDGRPRAAAAPRWRASIDAPRATSGANTSRGERPVSTASADSYWPIARCARAMSATTAARSASACAGRTRR